MTQWISVKDSLPMIDEVVLCFQDPYIFTGYLTLFDDAPTWVDTALFVEFEVTHWTPLPAAPA